MNEWISKQWIEMMINSSLEGDGEKIPPPKKRYNCM